MSERVWSWAGRLWKSVREDRGGEEERASRMDNISFVLCRLKFVRRGLARSSSSAVERGQRTAPVVEGLVLVRLDAHSLGLCR